MTLTYVDGVCGVVVQTVTNRENHSSCQSPLKSWREKTPEAPLRQERLLERTKLKADVCDFLPAAAVSDIQNQDAGASISANSELGLMSLRPEVMTF